MATSECSVLYVDWDTGDEDNDSVSGPPKYYKVPRILYEDNWANNAGHDEIAEWLSDTTGFLVRDWYLYSIEGNMP